MRGVIRRRVTTLHEVNITNLVDVVMAILIIYILITPILSNSGIEIKLPESESSDPLVREENSLIVRINQEGSYYLEGRQVDKEGILRRAQIQKSRDPGSVVLVEGDTRVAYGKVIELLGHLHAGGINSYGLVTENLPGADEKKEENRPR